MPTTVDGWLALEQANYSKYGVSHILGVIDVYESPVASTDIYMRNDKGKYCVKFLFVLSPTDEVLHCSAHPGCLTNQTILERSSFGRKLVDPANPLNIPRLLRFRDTVECATPCFLADGDWSAGATPFILVRPGSVQLNICRLSIERFLGRFTALNRCFLVYVLIENYHEINDMLYTAVNVYNFRLRKFNDPNHLHSIVCRHYAAYFIDSSRVVQGPAPSTDDNRRLLMEYHGVVVEAHRGGYMLTFPEPGEVEGEYDDEELEGWLDAEEENDRRHM